MVRRFLLLLIGAAALCVPAASVAANNPPSGEKLAAQMCSTLRTKDGKATFKQTYHSFASCLEKQTPNAKSDVQNAAKTCKAQRNDPNFATETGHDGKTFNQYYGTNTGSGKGAGANAYGKCVSSIAKQNAHSEVANTLNATATCKAQKQDTATFQAAYGTGRNAFGKCVSKQANAKTG